MGLQKKDISEISFFCFHREIVLFIQRTVSRAGAVVGAFQILRSESRPAVRPKQIVVAQIVHRNRDPQHACQRDQILADMTISEGAVVGAPVGHDGINILKRRIGFV